MNGLEVTMKLGSNGVAGINNIGFDVSADQLDITDFDSTGGFREFIDGLKSGTLSISGDFDPTDTNGQVVLINAILAGTLLTSTTKPVFTVDGTYGFTADCRVASFNVNPTVEGKVVVSYNMQMTSTIAFVTS